MKHDLLINNRWAVIIVTLYINVLNAKNVTQAPEKNIILVSKFTGSTRVYDLNKCMDDSNRKFISSPSISPQDWIQIVKIGHGYMGQRHRAGPYNERNGLIPGDFELADGSGNNIDCLKVALMMFDVKDAYVIIHTDTPWRKEIPSEEIMRQIVDQNVKMFSVVLSKSQSMSDCYAFTQVLLAHNGSIEVATETPLKLYHEAVNDLLLKVQAVDPILQSPTNTQSPNPEDQSTNLTSAAGIHPPIEWFFFSIIVLLILILR